MIADCRLPIAELPQQPSSSLFSFSNHFHRLWWRLRHVVSPTEGVPPEPFGTKGQGFSKNHRGHFSGAEAPASEARPSGEFMPQPVPLVNDPAE